MQGKPSSTGCGAELTKLTEDYLRLSDDPAYAPERWFGPDAASTDWQCGNSPGFLRLCKSCARRGGYVW